MKKQPKRIYATKTDNYQSILINLAASFDAPNRFFNCYLHEKYVLTVRKLKIYFLHVKLDL